MNGLFHDIRYTLRSITKNPGFATVVIVTLALAIGANATIFSVVHAVLLKPPPYPAERPGDVYVVKESAPQGGDLAVSYPDFRDWQRLNQSFEVLAGYRAVSGTLLGADEPAQIGVTHVTWDYFSLMGARPILGRLFTAGDDRPEAPLVCILNHTLWQTRFGAAPDAAGRVVQINSKPATIVGVLPPDFETDLSPRAYVPVAHWGASESAQDRGNHMDLFAIGRVKPGVDRETIRAEFETLARQLEQEYPQTNSGVGVAVYPHFELLIRRYRTALYLLLGAAAFVLLIACSNVANLQLARSAARRKDAAVRAALGGSKWRLVRQALTESVLLAALGGTLGVALADTSLSVLGVFLPDDLPRASEIALDWNVLAFAFAITTLTGVAFGLAPALRSTALDLSTFLKEGGRNLGQRSSQRLGRTFLLAQISFAVLLLVGAGLMLRTLWNLTHVDPGFRPDNLLTFRIFIRGSEAAPERTEQFRRALRERLESMPGVESAGLGLSFPMYGSHWQSVFVVDDRPAPERTQLPTSSFNPVAPGYFRTFGIELVEGRDFDNRDQFGSTPVVVVNEKLARAFWPGQSALGRRIKQGWPEDEDEDHPWREIVGVVGDVHQDSLDREPRMEVFLPIAQRSLPTFRVAVRTSGDPLALADPVRRVIHEIHATATVGEMMSMEQRFGRSLALRQITMNLLTSFAVLALLLAAVGIYGVMAFSVGRRTREVGLRLAVGAQRSDILLMITREGLRLTLFGLVIGVVAALALGRTMQSLLFGVEPADTLTFVLATGVTLVAATLACYLPARRAAAVDPMTALRYE